MDPLHAHAGSAELRAARRTLAQRRRERLELRDHLGSARSSCVEHPRRRIARAPRRWRAATASSSASSACTSAVAAPSRSDSPAKSPPTSSACRSPSANRSRTLASASFQPSVPVLQELRAAPRRWSARRPASPSIQPSGAATCGLPASASTRVISRSGLMPGAMPAKDLEDVRVAVDHAGVGLLGAHRQARSALRARSAPCPQLPTVRRRGGSARRRRRCRPARAARRSRTAGRPCRRRHAAARSARSRGRGRARQLGHRHLVALRARRRRTHLDDDVPHRRRSARLRRAITCTLDSSPALAGEPALARQPLEQQVGQARQQSRGARSGQSAAVIGRSRLRRRRVSANQ